MRTDKLVSSGYFEPMPFLWTVLVLILSGSVHSQDSLFHAPDDSLELPSRFIRVRVSEGTPDSSGHRVYLAKDIANLLCPSREKVGEAMLLQSADIIPDEDGRMHARGEDAQIQYIVDGIPWPGNPTRIYSSLYSTDMAKSVDIHMGGLPAQYVGGSAVVDVTMQDGLTRPFALRAGAGAGSFGTRDVEGMASGRLGERTGLVLNASHSQTNRYLDPISGFTAIHDAGHSNHVFGKLTALATTHLELRFMGAYDASDFEIPNLKLRNPGQDQGQALRSYLMGARADLDLGAGTSLAFSLYARGTKANLTSGGLSRLAGTQDSLQAIAENERYFLGAFRQEGYHGGLAELTLHPRIGGRIHRIHAGVSGEYNPLSESLAFAITDSALAGPNGDPRLLTFDLTHGGHSLETQEVGTGWTAATYAEDAFALGAWNLALGLRYDAFSIFKIEQAVSPRLATSYTVSPTLNFWASLDWVTSRAPLEYILLSSSRALLPLSGSEQGNTHATVGAERAIVFDLGSDVSMGPYWILDGGVYGKYIRDFLVKAELGNSGLIFPINLKRGLVAGGQLRLRLREWQRLSGTLSLGGCASLGLKPDDGSSPIAAGLLVGEEGHNYGHPFAGEDFFPTEHNQIATGVLNMRYQLPMGFAFNWGGRFDSGLPFDLVANDGSGLDAVQSRAELKRRGYGDDVIDLLSLDPEKPGSPDKSVAPHAVFDLGLTYQVKSTPGPALEMHAAILNVLDTPYLYKFESSFGSTHFGQPRSFGLWVDLSL